MPCQSHGDDGVDVFQDVKELSGSRRLFLKVVKAWISLFVVIEACVMSMVVKYVRDAMARNIAVVAIYVSG